MQNITWWDATSSDLSERQFETRPFAPWMKLFGITLVPRVFSLPHPTRVGKNILRTRMRQNRLKFCKETKKRKQKTPDQFISVYFSLFFRNLDFYFVLPGAHYPAPGTTDHIYKPLYGTPLPGLPVIWPDQWQGLCTLQAVVLHCDGESIVWWR